MLYSELRQILWSILNVVLLFNVTFNQCSFDVVVCAFALRSLLLLFSFLFCIHLLLVLLSLAFTLAVDACWRCFFLRGVRCSFECAFFFVSKIKLSVCSMFAFMFVHIFYSRPVVFCANCVLSQLFRRCVSDGIKVKILFYLSLEVYVIIVTKSVLRENVLPQISRVFDSTRAFF